MYYLTSIDMCPNRELESELSYFFQRIRMVRRRLHEENASLVLNRMQRMRCKGNLLTIEKLENEFHRISHSDDVKIMYRKIQQYVKLDHERLMHTFGRQKVKATSLFITI